MKSNDGGMLDICLGLWLAVCDKQDSTCLYISRLLDGISF